MPTLRLFHQISCVRPISRTALKNEGLRTGALPRFSNLNLIVPTYLEDLKVDIVLV